MYEPDAELKIDLFRWFGGAAVFLVHVAVDDPRMCPTRGVVVVTNARRDDLVLAESLGLQLQQECEWPGGFIERIEKSSGGIGADGVTLISLFLGAVGALPEARRLVALLRRTTPKRPDREYAWHAATWAVAMQYQKVPRRDLILVSEERKTDSWVFKMCLPRTNDEFEVQVAGGNREGATTVVRLVWTNGEPWSEREAGE